MNTLILDCTNGLYVAVVAGDKCFEFSDDGAKQQSNILLEKIDELLTAAGLKIQDISVIALNVGPGSFTGIRVAIATAKGLAVGTKAKIVTFNAFEAVSVALKDRNYGVIVEGFGNNFYYHFKKYGKIFQGCSTSDKLLVLAKDIPIYSVSKAVCEAIKDFKVQPATYNGKLVVETLVKQNKWVETNKIAPLYLRASQAELERLKNGNKI